MSGIRPTLDRRLGRSSAQSKVLPQKVGLIICRQLPANSQGWFVAVAEKWLVPMETAVLAEKRGDTAQVARRGSGPAAKELELHLSGAMA